MPPQPNQAVNTSFLKRLATRLLHQKKTHPNTTPLPNPPSSATMSTSAAPTDPSSLRRLEPSVVKQILEAPAKETAVVLDVRELDEVTEGALAGRAHLASGEFSDPAKIDALLDGPLARKEKVIVHCMHSQKRGPACAAKLADRIKEREAEGKTGAGPEVVVLKGGYHEFVQQFGADHELIVKGLPKGSA